MTNNPFDFSENLDYSQTGKHSIWGEGDKETLVLLQELSKNKKIFGDWLHFASGDGRYNTILLSQVDSLVATDIDGDALEKLKMITPHDLLKKLSTQVQDITLPFPFESGTFDGAFNTGILNLFSKEVIGNIFKEVKRILKKDGIFIFDLATDVKREKPDGELISVSGIEYSKQEAKDMLIELLQEVGFKFELHEGIVPPEKVNAGSGEYTFSCNYWLVVVKV